MSRRSRLAVRRRWLATAAFAGALALAAASCRQDVPLGVAPNSDAAASSDAHDGGAG